MSTAAEPVAPIAPPPAAPVPPTADDRSVLPAGVVVNPVHDASEFFKKHKEANPDVVPPPKPAEPPPAKPADTKIEPTPEPAAKPGLADKLLKKTPTSAAAPAPDKKPDAAQDDFLKTLESAPPPDMSKKGAVAEHFDKWKGEAKHHISGLSTKIGELEKQLAEARKAPVSAVAAPEVEKLKAEHKEMSDRLLILDAQNHPQFRQQFTEPKKAVLENAANILTENGVAGIDVAGLLAKPRSEFGKAVSEASSKLSDFDKTEFQTEMKRAWDIQQNERAALGRSRETLQAIQQQNQSRGQQAFDSVAKELTSAVGEFMPTMEVPDGATADVKDEIEKYNAAAQFLPEAAKKIAFDVGDEKAVAKHAFKSAAYDFHINHALPKLLHEHQGAIDMIASLRKELTDIRARNPNLNRHAPAGSDNGAPDPSKMTHAEAARFFAAPRTS